MSVASRPSTRASKLPVTQLVFVARGSFLRSTPCVCALRGFLPGRVFSEMTTRRHGLARPPPNWVGWAERLVTHYMQAHASSTGHRGWPPHPPPWVAVAPCCLNGDSAPSLAPLLPALDAPTRFYAQEEPPPAALVHTRRPDGVRDGADMQLHRGRRRDGAIDNAARDLAGVTDAGADSWNQGRLNRIPDADE